MVNKWMVHLKQYRQEFREKNKKLKPQQIMKDARKTYKKDNQQGGNAVSGYTEKGLASNASKVGGRVSAYEGSNLATTAARVGGRKSRRRNRSRARRTRRS